MRQRVPSRFNFTLLRTHLEASPTILRKNASPPNDKTTGHPDRKLCKPQNLSSPFGLLFPTTWGLVHHPRPGSEFRFYVKDLNRLTDIIHQKRPVKWRNNWILEPWQWSLSHLPRSEAVLGEKPNFISPHPPLPKPLNSPDFSPFYFWLFSRLNIGLKGLRFLLP